MLVCSFDDSQGEELLPAYERCRLEAVAALERQAARMRRNVEQKLGKLLLEEGDLVRISVPDVDRGRLDPPVLCMVVVEVCEFDEGRDVKYRLAAAKTVRKAVCSTGCIAGSTWSGCRAQMRRCWSHFRRRCRLVGGSSRQRLCGS